MTEVEKGHHGADAVASKQTLLLKKSICQIQGDKTTVTVPPFSDELRGVH